MHAAVLGPAVATGVGKMSKPTFTGHGVADLWQCHTQSTEMEARLACCWVGGREAE